MSPPLFEILAYESTPLGDLCLRRRELLSEPGTLVTEITLNHEFLMSSLHTDSERTLALGALARHEGDSLTILVGGLGLGYTAQAALSSPRVSSVEVVELLPQVIDWTRQGLVPLAPELNADSRLKLLAGDIYAQLGGPPTQCHDLILIDVDHSPDDNLDEINAPFYTESGLRQARLHLNPKGVLAVWSSAESSPFADALHAVFDEVEVEPVTYFNRHIHEEFTDWLFFARAGDSPLPGTSD